MRRNTSFMPLIDARVLGLFWITVAIAAVWEPAAGAQDLLRGRTRDLVMDAEFEEPVFGQRPIGDAEFDRLVFGSEGAVQLRRRLEFSLTARVSRVDRICLLSDAQRKKLQLAGRGDIKQFFDRVESSRRKLRQEPLDRTALQSVLKEIRRLPHGARPELFGAKSLFEKILSRTLTAEQLARYETVTLREHVARHRATIKWVVGNLDSTLQLSRAQHHQLEALLVEETQPPERFGEYDYYGVVYQMSLFPEKKIRRILEDEQWVKLARQFAEASRLGPTLREGGFLPAGGVARTAPARGHRPATGNDNPQG
jgi:hypothetical protein